MKQFFKTNSVIYFITIGFLVVVVFDILDLIFGKETPLSVSELILVTGIVVWGMERDERNKKKETTNE